MAFIKKYYGPVLLVVALSMYLGYSFLQSRQFNDLQKEPKPGDIYIFESNNTFSPYLIDIVTEDSLYLFSHPYDYSEALPSVEQVLEDSFNDNIHYIYDKSEVQRLIEGEKIIKIYR